MAADRSVHKSAHIADSPDYIQPDYKAAADYSGNMVDHTQADSLRIADNSDYTPDYYSLKDSEILEHTADCMTADSLTVPDN